MSSDGKREWVMFDGTYRGEITTSLTAAERYAIQTYLAIVTMWEKKKKLDRRAKPEKAIFRFLSSNFYLTTHLDVFGDIPVFSHKCLYIRNREALGKLKPRKLREILRAGR